MNADKSCGSYCASCTTAALKASGNPDLMKLNDTAGLFMPMYPSSMASQLEAIQRAHALEGE
jgi:hypothetical protein